MGQEKIWLWSVSLRCAPGEDVPPFFSVVCVLQQLYPSCKYECTGTTYEKYHCLDPSPEQTNILWVEFI